MNNAGLLSKVATVEFWAREHRIPLFWLTDKRHTSVGDGTLFLYEKSIVHCYFVNERITTERQSGKDYFSSPSRFDDFMRVAKEMMESIAKTSITFRSLDLRSLSQDQLHEQFQKFVVILCEFTDLYTKTEAEKLRSFEGSNDQKLKAKLFEVGKMRFDMRASVEMVFHILLGDILHEIARRFALKPLDLFFYNDEEVRSLFRGVKVESNEIALRRKGYVLLQLDGQTELLTGELYKQARKLIRQLTKPETQELRGQVAHPGIVRGTVELLIHNTSKLAQRAERFTEGRVLVTEMTTPDTVIACKKAIAIVTDEGGILCHAAIVSRELGKPCIVGTKHATQMLKNGDLVEVDAMLGTVRIVK